MIRSINMQHAVNIDDTLLQQALKLSGLSQEQTLEEALKLFIKTTSQKNLWLQQAMKDEQLQQAAQEYVKEQWIQCRPEDIDKLL